MLSITTFWIIFGGILTFVLVSLVVESVKSYRQLQPTLAVATTPPIKLPVPAVTQVAERTASDPDRMSVMEILGGSGTLVIRERSRRKVVTAHLIIWAGDKRKRIEDSYYDLGLVAGEYGDQAVANLTKTALDKMHELKGGSNASQVAPAPAVVPAAATTPPVAPEAPPAGTDAVSVEDNQASEPAIKMMKFPSIYRGRILEVGYMPRAIGEEEKSCYGVRYQTPEGIEDVTWGVNLKTALREANAGVGDSVEILKLGRKTMEKGKAPMNLYRISKLQA